MINKIIFALLAIFISITPALGIAAEERAGDQIVVGRGEVVEDDLYIAAGEVVIDGIVRGDLYVIGGNVTITGQVTEDVLVIAGMVKISGKVGGDLRVGSGDIEISGEIGDEILAGVGTINILSDGKVGGSIIAGVGSAIISGQTDDIRIQVGSLTINDSAKIEGDLKYWSSQEASIAKNASINGRTDFTKVEDYSSSYYQRGIDFPSKVYSLLSSIFIALLLVYLMPIISYKLASNWRNKAGMNFLWGFLFLIVTPIVALFLLVLILSIPLAIGLMMIYTIILYLAKITAIIGLGFCIQNYFVQRDKKRQATNLDWITVLIGSLVYYLISLIPTIGGLVTFVLSMIGLGTIISIKYIWFKDLRKKKKI